MRFSWVTAGITCASIVVPIGAIAASSDAFPWSDEPTSAPEAQTAVVRDQYGALRDSSMQPDLAGTSSASTSQALLQPVAANRYAPGRASLRTRAPDIGRVPPGSTVSDVGMAQGNLGPTQSGPGAVGLFTPNNPGNAAAYDAQLSRGLQGAPIVDGAGANMRIFVPVPTPSGNSSYLQYMSGGVTGVVSPQTNGLRYFDKSFGAAPAYGSDWTVNSGNAASASSSRSGVTRSRLSADNHRASRLSAPNWLLKDGARGNSSVASASNSTLDPSKTRMKHGIGSTHRSSNKLRADSPQGIVSSLGDVTGRIQYADGSVVLFGKRGTLRLSNDMSGTLSRRDGAVMRFHDFSGNVQRLAQSKQLDM